MTRYLLDTDVSIDFLDQSPAVQAFVAPLAPSGIAVSVISYMEMYQGALRGSVPDAATSELRRFLDDAPALPVTIAVAERCAEIRADLQRRGRSTRPRALDLLIAATAIEHGLTLVTRNVSDYGDIPGLRLLTPPGSASPRT